MHLSKLALTLLRAHYRALIQHAQRAALVAVLVPLGALPSLPAQAADNVNAIITGKKDDNQSWGEYLTAKLNDDLEQQWESSNYTVATTIQGIPWSRSKPNITNTWVKGVKMPSGSLYGITLDQPVEVTWDNVIFTESASAASQPLASLATNISTQSLLVKNALFYKNKTTNTASVPRTISFSIIYTDSFNITIQDSAFIGNNIAKYQNRNSGVIETDNTITIKAVKSDVIFAENTITNSSDEAPAIAFTGNDHTVELQAGTGRAIVFDDPIVNTEQYGSIGLTVNNEEGNDGTVVFGSGLETAMRLGTVSVGYGTLAVENAPLSGQQHSIGTLNLAEPAALSLMPQAKIEVRSLDHKGQVNLAPDSKLIVTGSWTPAANAKIAVEGNATISAPTISFSNPVTVSFATEENQQPTTNQALLTLEQTNAKQAINLNNVTIAADVDIEQALQSQDGVILMKTAGTEGFTGDPKFHNNMFELDYDPATGNFTIEAISTTDPDTPDPENPTVPEPPEQETPTQPETPEHEAPLSPEEQQQAAIETFTNRLGNLGANTAQQQVFKGMMRAYGTTENSPYYEDFDQLWRYLQLAPVPEMLGALSALTPDYSAMVLTHERALNEDVTDAVFNQQNAQPLGAHSALWLKASTVSGEHEGASAFELDRNSVALGLSTKLTPSWDLRAGFALSDFEGNTSSHDLEGDAYRLFVGSTYQVPVGSGTFELGGVVQAGQSSYEESLSHPVLGQHSTDYDVTTVGAALRAGYTLETERGAISPELKLSYLHADSDGLTAPLGQSVSDAQADLLTVQAGVDFKAKLLTTPSTQLTLTGGLHAAYDLVAEGLERTVTLADGSGYQLEGMEPDDFRLLPQLSLELSLYESLKLEAGFRRSQGDDYRENLWQVKAQYIY